ncbi:hypothetical protein Syun_030909 [Stephania yunnanensis]|uniref:DYW domain-containing protein n=1 Tax=Stephania yunnanensis TaxID=152371 RepID=A0AAP0HES0_9MAGN
MREYGIGVKPSTRRRHLRLWSAFLWRCSHERDQLKKCFGMGEIFINYCKIGLQKQAMKIIDSHMLELEREGNDSLDQDIIGDQHRKSEGACVERVAKLKSAFPPWSKLEFGVVELGFQVHARLIVTGVQLCAFLSSQVLELYCDYEETIRLFYCMVDGGVRPDHFVFPKVFKACSELRNRKCGMMDFARKLFEEMEFKDVVVWNMMVSGYASNGDFEQALKCFEDMKLVEFKDVASIWPALSSVNFPWIAVKRRIHSFIVGDASHPLIEEISAKVESLYSEIKEIGYVPETNFVLQDVEDDEKENSLCGHSEKLAIAFGLISTPSGTPLRIIKNLRLKLKNAPLIACYSQSIEKALVRLFKRPYCGIARLFEKDRSKYCEEDDRFCKNIGISQDKLFKDRSDPLMALQ